MRACNTPGRHGDAMRCEAMQGKYKSALFLSLSQARGFFSSFAMAISVADARKYPSDAGPLFFHANLRKTFAFPHAAQFAPVLHLTVDAHKVSRGASAIPRAWPRVLTVPVPEALNLPACSCAILLYRERERELFRRGFGFDTPRDPPYNEAHSASSRISECSLLPFAS